VSLWPEVPLSRAIQQQRATVVIDDASTYRRCRVKQWGKGAVLRDEVPGWAIKTKVQQVCERGQLVVAEIDAKVGGLAIVPPDLAGAVVSRHYFLYDVDCLILDPAFLGWYLRSERFQSQVIAQGTTNYAAIRAADVLEYLVPLPPLHEQRRVSNGLDALEQATIRLRRLADGTTSALDAVLLSVFGEITQDVPKARMRDVAPIVRRRVVVEPAGTYAEMGLRSFGRGPFHKPTTTGIDLGAKSVYEIRPGDLVFSNVFAWEGAIAVARAEDAGRIGSHRFITCEPQAEMALSPFLNFYFHTPAGLADIGAASPGGAGRNRTLSTKGLGVIEVPCPDLAAQTQFVALADVVAEVRNRFTAAVANGEQVLTTVASRYFDCPTANCAGA